MRFVPACLTTTAVLALCACGHHQGGGTDLILGQGVSYSPANPVAGQSVTITFSIEDLTSDNVAFTNVPWVVNRDGVPAVFSGVFPQVVPNTALQQNFTDTPAAGVHVYTIIIDPNHTLVGVNENQTFQFFTLTILPASSG